jgi:hypothetical protein
MVKIESSKCTAHLRIGELGRVEIVARSGEKAATVNVRVGDDPASMVRELKSWLGFGKVTERKLVTAVNEMRASNGVHP